MSAGDAIAIVGYFLLAGATLALAERAKRRGLPGDLTRKGVHIVAGLSPLYAVAGEDLFAERRRGVVGEEVAGVGEVELDQNLYHEAIRDGRLFGGDGRAAGQQQRCGQENTPHRSATGSASSAC